jgi:ParB-like chromosome segregation protein Spo0J
MAKVSPQTLTIIFNLQRRLVELIDQAKTAEYHLFEDYGETEETIPELEQLQNGAERLRNPYSRLATLTLAIAEAQPIAPTAMINLLAQTVEEASASSDAVEASIMEIKRSWNLP